MKRWNKITVTLMILMLTAVWVHAAGVPEFLHSGYEALFYHSIRLEDSFPSVNPLGLAIAEFERAAKIGGGAGEANLMLGMIYQFLDRPGTALGYLLQFSQANPEKIWVNSMIGDLYAEMGRRDEARVYYKKALAGSETEPILAQAYFGLGAIAYEREEYEEAKEAFTLALEDSGDYFDAHLALGKTLFQLGEYDEAIETLEQAQLIAPRYKQLHYFLALAYEAVGLTEKAEHAHQRVKELE